MTLKYIFSKFLKKLQIPAIKDSRIDKTSRVCSGSHLVNVSMQKYSYIGNFCTVINAEIGKFCSIADNCIIGGNSHPLNWVSTSPVFHKGKNIMNKNFSEHEFVTTSRIIIGNDVWLGNNVLIKGGVTIGNGAVIGMGSVVTKSVGDYEIWAGNPAKIIRKRFDEDTIRQLLDIEWWNCQDKVIYNNAIFMNDILKFIELNRKGSK